jgi:transcriptional regulator with XRE-family HTH domain
MALPDDRRHMVGERLAELREQKALTLRDLEEVSGVGADAISKIENGHRKPRPSTLRKLARALGVEVEDFFREPALPLAKAPREAGPPQVSREELLAQGITATDDEVQELNNRLMLDWRWGQGEKAVSYFKPEDVDEARVGMLVHLALNTPSIITPEAAGVVRQGMRERLKA